jgi:hypothetical protein
VVLLASALALAACGGGSNSSGGGSDETAIEEAIETAATSTDPAKCTEVQTEFFNETESGKSGAAALKACEEEVEAGEDQAETVTVTNVEIEGEGAAAEAEIEGSALNGQTIAIAMEEKEGDWKVDGFMGFVKYDPAALATGLEAGLVEEEGFTPELASCIAEGVAEMSQEEAQEMVFEKNNDGLEELAATCKE